MTAPYLRRLGVTVEPSSPGGGRVCLEASSAHRNRNGTLHGGVTASLLAAAAEQAVGDDAAWRPLDLAVTYLAPGAPGPLVATARILGRVGAVVPVTATLEAAGSAALARALVALGPDLVPVPGVPAGPPPADALPDARPSRSPFSNGLGLAVALRARGTALGHLPWTADAADVNGRLHAGALATLADSVCGASTWSLVGFDPRGRAATLTLRLGLHAAVHTGTVIARADTSASAPTTYTTVVTMWNTASGVIVATGAVVYRIVLPARASPRHGWQ